MSAHPLTAGTTNTVATTTAQEIGIKLQQSWPWYVARGAGMTAAALLVLLIISGIGLVTGFTYWLLEPVMAWSVHRAIAIAFIVSGFIHVFSLLFDRYVGFSVWQLIVPFTSHYDPVAIDGFHVGSLYVALGVIGMYVACVIVWTSLFWSGKRPRAWRTLHYLSYALVAMVFFHALFLGTDLQHGFLRTLWLLLGSIIVVGIVARLRRARTINQGTKK